jgi:hypothetical protein
MTKRILSYSDKFTIVHDTKPDNIETTSTDTQKLFGVDTIGDLIAFEYLKTKLPFKFGSAFETCKSSNPLFEQYTSWLENWRRESAHSRYEWREKMQTFQHITSNEDIQIYVRKLSTLRFVNYDLGIHTNTSIVEAELKKAIALKASNYINSIDRSELQTVSTDDGKVILKNDNLRDIGNNTNGSE